MSHRSRSRGSSSILQLYHRVICPVTAEMGQAGWGTCRWPTGNCAQELLGAEPARAGELSFQIKSQ